MRIATSAVSIAFAVLAIPASPATAQPRAMTAEDVLAIRDVSGAQISPDGRRVLFVVRGVETPTDKPDRRESRSHVWIADAKASGAARQITFAERGETSPAWSPDGAWISFVSARGEAREGDDGPRPQIWIMRADGGEPARLTDAREGVGAYSWSNDAKKLAFVSKDALSKEAEDKRKRRDDARVFEDDFQQTHLWVVDVATRTATKVTDDSAYTVGTFSWSPDGTRIAFSHKPTPLIRDYRTDLSIVTVGTKAVTKLAATAAEEGAPAWSPDGKTIAYLAQPNDSKPAGDGRPAGPLGHQRLMLYDVAAGTAKDASARDMDSDVAAPVWTPDGRRILFNSGRRVYREMFAYDVATGKYSALTRDQVIAFGSQSKDGARVAYTLSTADAPADVYVANGSFAGAERVTDLNGDVRSFALGSTEVITWKSPDGTEVEGLLLKPAGYQAGKKYPMVVEIHGGPTGAFFNNFKDSGHMWAGTGWAVLYPNPRGSTNYGEKFMRANVGDWGVGDYKDIMAGVDAVVARGIADPEKLAVMGWSYGGYMTCWVVSQTTRFKAAMVGAGLTNLYSMYGTNDIPNYMQTFFNGYPGNDNLTLYLQRSGITYADKVTTPTLILHGGSDERVPIGQPMEFFRALKDRGKTVELVFYPREGHGLTEYFHRLDRLKRQFEWITKYTLSESAKRPTSSQ